MAGGGFEGRVAAVTETISRGRDLTSQLSKLSVSGSQMLAAIRSQTRVVRDLMRESDRLQDSIAAESDDVIKRKLGRQLDAVSEKIAKIRTEMGKTMSASKMLFGGIDKLGKGFLKLNVGLLTSTFDLLAKGIMRVYELQERWTRAIGGLNMKVGALTAGLRGVQKAATQWSSTIRGLTDGDITEGIQLFTDFQQGIGRVVSMGDKFSRFGIQMARGFDLGGASAGELARAFENMGHGGGSASTVMSELAEAANLAHVPVNMLAKDVADANDYMVRFGKGGARAFVTAAGYARQFGISMKELQKVTERFDMFDDAAQTAAKINVVFKTSINAMDLLLEDDPAARFEMIRQELLAQGQTYESLTPKMVRFLTEQTGLNEKQLAATLNLQNANKSYAQFQKEQLAHEESEAKAKKQMEYQLRKTAQTMYAFGVAFDRITVAIANAIRPLLEVVGLAKSGGKEFKSFGQVMENITRTIVDFFNSLAASPKWQRFMRTLAKDMVAAGSALKGWVTSGKAADFVGSLAEGMRQFYGFAKSAFTFLLDVGKRLMPVFQFLMEHVGAVMGVWLGAKAVRGVGSTIAGAKEIVGAMGLGGGSKRSSGPRVGADGSNVVDWSQWKGKSKMAKVLGKGGPGMAAAAAALGGLVGGEGGGIGGAIGGLLGPIGAIAGTLIGALVQDIFKSGKSKLDLAREDLAKSQERAAKSAKRHADMLDIVNANQAAGDARRKQADQAFRALRSKKEDLDRYDLDMLRQRADNLRGFGKGVGGALDSLNRGVKPTKAQLDALVSASAAYDKQLQSLRDAAQQLADEQMRSVELTRLQTQKAGLETKIKRADLDVTAAKDERDKIKPWQKMMEAMARGDKASADKWRKEYNRLNKNVTDAEIRKIGLEKSLAEKSYDLDEKLFFIQLRKGIMGEEGFLTFKKGLGANVSEAQAFKIYAGLNANRLMTDYGLTGEELGQLRNIPKLASGGVVTRPTLAMVGEAGPEAVVPLRAAASGVPNAGARRAGVAPLKNYVGSKQSGGTERVVVGDVYMDSQKVGRALVRTILESR